MAISPASRQEERVRRQTEQASSGFSIALPLKQLADAAAWAIAGYPNEACGVLIGRNGGGITQVHHVTEARNLNVDSPHNRYRLDPEAFLRADRWATEHGLEIVGIWHSHPNAAPVPSETDLEAAWPGYSYLIISVNERRAIAVRSWRLDGEAFVEEKIES